MEFVLLIGLPALLAIGFLVWYLRSDRGVVSPTETPIRRRESARDWQRRLAAGPSLEGHFLQPTQNEILETLYVLDHLTPGWETDPADVTERNFLNELALSFPSLRKPGGEYPLPFAERLAIKSAGTKSSGASVSSEEEVSAIREKYQLARAHANALEQIASGTPRPATVASGSLPFRLTTEAAPIPGGHNPWLARLAGAVILGAAVVGIVQFLPKQAAPEAVVQTVAPAAEPAPVTLPPAAPEASPLPAPASTVAEPAPAASPAAVAVVAAVSPTPGEVPTPAPSTPDPARAALLLRIAASKQRALNKYPALAVEGSEINLRFVFRYKTLVQQKSPRLLDPDWPEKLVEECAAASESSLKHTAFTQVNGPQR